MKINIEQLPSGAYRIRKTVRGKTYRVTVDYRPTESEALRLLADVMGKGGMARTPLTFGEAAGSSPRWRSGSGSARSSCRGSGRSWRLTGIYRSSRKISCSGS